MWESLSSMTAECDHFWVATIRCNLLVDQPSLPSMEGCKPQPKSVCVNLVPTFLNFHLIGLYCSNGATEFVSMVVACLRYSEDAVDEVVEMPTAIHSAMVWAFLPSFWA